MRYTQANAQNVAKSGWMWVRYVMKERKRVIIITMWWIGRRSCMLRWI